MLPHKPGKRPGRIKQQNNGTQGDGQAPVQPEILRDLQIVVLRVAGEELAAKDCLGLFLVVVMKKEKKERIKERRDRGEGQRGWGKGEGTHGDGGSGKKKHCYGCDSFHDFAVGENDLGILLGDHVKALSPAQFNCQLYRISHYKHQCKEHNIFLRLWGGKEEKRERIKNPVPN